MKNRMCDGSRKLAFLSRKGIVLLVAMALLLGLVVSSTIAYLVSQTEGITNTFIPTQITPPIVEDFDGEVKENVKLTNTGNIDAYIRATWVATWQDAQGAVYPTMPTEGTDYTISLNLSSGGWFKGSDGYYYYAASVAPSGETAVLITECKPVEGKAPDGYFLCVEVLGSAIQTVPETAVTDAWKVVEVKSGKLQAKSGGDAQ